MKENKMNEVAALLGIKLEEEFIIEGFSNRYKFSKDGLMYLSDTLGKWNLSSSKFNMLLTGEAQIVKLPKPILNSAEKEFLSAIIDSVKDRVIYIKRCLGGVYSGYIDIHLKSYTNAVDGEIVITSNCFEKETMFNRMEFDRKYSLEELGL